MALRHSPNERAGLVERRWWPATALAECADKLLPAELPELFETLLNGRFPTAPLALIA